MTAIQHEKLTELSGNPKCTLLSLSQTTPKNGILKIYYSRMLKTRLNHSSLDLLI